MQRLQLAKPVGWHLALIGVVACLYEVSFLHRPPENFLDEGWPLYAALRLHAGGVLYRDVFFVFPPGHLLAAWTAFWLDPPGIESARIVYSAFNVSIAVALYWLGCRIMTPGGALVGALLLAVAAPAVHGSHSLFGYRYMVFSALALLAFSQRLRTGNARWMFVAGILTGIALCFRITPAIAVGLALAVGCVCANRGWRDRFTDAAWLAGGFIVVVAPIFAVVAHPVGLEAMLRSVFVRPVVMTQLQSWPVPEVVLPVRWDRDEITFWFEALQFRLFPMMFAAYGAVLAWRYWVSRKAATAFAQPLLLAIVIWGGVYFVRSLGRADETHLASALPPACLLLGHLLDVGLRRLNGSETDTGDDRSHELPSSNPIVRIAVSVVVLAGWIVLSGSDRPVVDGLFPRADASMGFVAQRESFHAMEAAIPRFDATEAGTQERPLVLDLSASPLSFVLNATTGPGYFDVVMPGTFLDADEERSFVAHLDSLPDPRAVYLPSGPFDGMEERSYQKTAPLVTQWVRSLQRRVQERNRMTPAGSDPGGD